MPVRVLIADDLELFRSAPRAVVQATAGFEVAGEAVSGEDSLEAARRLRPDLVLMEVNLPGISGLEATRRIRRAFPKTVVLLLSTRNTHELEPRAAECGAAAYVPKSTLGSQRLIEAWAAARTSP